MDFSLIELGSDASLQLMQEMHAGQLFELIEQNREYLRVWLPWLDTNISLEDSRHFIQSVCEQYEKGLGPQFTLWTGEQMAGVVGFHKIDQLNKSATLGYWLSEEFMGRGLVTRGVNALLKIGFSDYQLENIKIHCAEQNHKSRAVAERMGFSLIDYLPNKEWLYTHFVNHVVYSMTAAEYWKRTFVVA